MAERRFDFLQDLVASVADINADGDTEPGTPTPRTPMTPVTPSFPMPGSAPAMPNTPPAYPLTTPISAPPPGQRIWDFRSIVGA